MCNSDKFHKEIPSFLRKRFPQSTAQIFQSWNFIKKNFSFKRSTDNLKVNLHNINIIIKKVENLIKYYPVIDLFHGR